MLTLALTTTTKLAGISLHEGKRTLGEIRVEVVKTHSTTILDQIDRLFIWTGKNLSDVENLLVSVGPGSFTGVRIAIALTKGMFYGKRVNIYEVNELEALAYQVFYNLRNLVKSEEIKGKKIYSLIDSGKEKIYYAIYQVKDSSSKGLERISSYEVCRLENLMEEINKEKEEVILIGDAVSNYRGKIERSTGEQVKFPLDSDMKITTATFMEMFLEGNLKKTDIFPLKPYYLEKSQAERDKK